MLLRHCINYCMQLNFIFVKSIQICGRYLKCLFYFFLFLYCFHLLIYLFIHNFIYLFFLFQLSDKFFYVPCSVISMIFHPRHQSEVVDVCFIVTLYFSFVLQALCICLILHFMYFKYITYKCCVKPYCIHENRMNSSCIL